MSETVAAKARSGTVHEFAEDEKAPTCGTQAILGPAANNNVGAKKSHEVDVDDVDPWKLCEKCYPERYKEYPDNDHWFDVEPAWKWDGALGGDFSCFVTCQKCAFALPCRSKSEAYSVGYEHKRYPERDLGR